MRELKVPSVNRPICEVVGFASRSLQPTDPRKH